MIYIKINTFGFYSKRGYVAPESVVQEIVYHRLSRQSVWRRINFAGVACKIDRVSSHYTTRQIRGLDERLFYIQATFLRADLYADYGFADKDPEAYVAQSVFNYKKAK